MKSRINGFLYKFKYNKIMALPKLKQGEVFTYGFYKNWPEDERWEIINGVPYNMSPGPRRIHQKISGVLFNKIYNFLDKHDCEVYDAPFDVRLPDFDEADDDVLTVVQPDIVVVCDEKKLDDAGCRGAPDFIIEILSPSTASKDQIEKVALYEKHGVKEYWIVHPTDKILTVRLLDETKKYQVPFIYDDKKEVEIKSLPGLKIKLKEVFKNI